MRNRKGMLWAAVWAAVMMVSLQASAATISLNFSENSTNQVFSGGAPIGPLGTNSTFWNMTDQRDSGTLASGTKSGLIDDTGVNTGVSVTWRSSNLWWNRDGTGDDEHKLAVGYLDDGTTDTGVGIQVTFTDIPYLRYRVYGLLATDQDQNNSGTTPPYSFPSRNYRVNEQWVLGGDASTTARAYGGIGRNFDAHGSYWTLIEPGVTVGNYWTFENSGSTLAIRGLPRNGSQRGCVTAVIIEEINPLLGYDPVPAVGTEAPVNQTLSWAQVEDVSDLGVTYRVYFGTEPNATNPNYYGITPVKTTTTDASDFFYDPVDDLSTSTTYYWRVDALEPNLPGDPIVHTGPEWWFVTQPPSPRIEVHPVSVTVAAGTAQVEFAVAGINIESYQWFKNGQPLPADPSRYVGQDGPMLTVFDIQIDDEGFYHCEGDNSLNEPSASSAAQLLTQRLVGWWKLDGDLTDSVGQVYPGATVHDGVSVDPNFVMIGKDGGAIEFFGDVDGLARFPGSAEFYNFYPRGYTVSAWVNMPPKTTGTWGAYVVKQDKVLNRGFLLAHNGSGVAQNTLRQSFNDLGSGTDVDDNDWHLVVGTYDAATKQGKVYVDGVLKGQATHAGTPTGHSVDLLFGAEDLAAQISPYIGLLDDVRIWSYVLDPVDVAHLYVDFNPGVDVCVTHPFYDIAGPDGVGDEFRDCRVNLYDLMPIIEAWLECNLLPTCIN